ncbi:DinB family protein [Mangrovivirga sp. M17]|uniref:DinB family protein n=1 Tax=Mangrovivirga halotolerans TaxID=2993936 RepID=A0ABT3RMW0_9BACT|nr:DinB family protein [Mangrovivirga halotolerans]MCX2742806.1 DinB family protein [Mangrovivirga halotolerans]
MQDNSINHTIVIHKSTRNHIHKLWNSLSPHQLATIPKGYKNNILWNVAHCLVTHQLLIYGLSNLKMNLPLEFIEKYRKGTTPTDNEINDEDVKIINDNILSQAEQLAKDYPTLFVKGFNEYQTSYGVKLNSIIEAINFNNTHEALHLGIIMSQAKYLRETS